MAVKHHFSQLCQHEVDLDGDMWLIKSQGEEVMRGSMAEVQDWLDQQENIRERQHDYS